MTVARDGGGMFESARASFWIFASLAGVACGATLLYLGMRGVMEVGGACADGGPYVSRQPCPDGVPLATMGGIWFGIICFGIYVFAAIRYRVPSFIALAWSALFLSLGWNFLEFGINPPDYNDQQQYSFFGELQIPVLDNLNFQAAARREEFSGGLGATVYKVSGKWDVWGPLSIRGSYGTNYQAPPVGVIPGEVTNAVRSYSRRG